MATANVALSSTLPESATELANDLSALWLLICAFLVFFMQPGFALLESGTVRSKNTKNILLKNVIDACVGAVSWWAVGQAFAFAWGNPCNANGFIGYSGFFSSDASHENYFPLWIFNYAFCATASTIMSGAVAERTQFRSYMVYTTAMTSFIYPVVAHWVWSRSGWLSARRTACEPVDAPHDPLFSSTNGMIDFAGSGVVHMVGGMAALIGAITVGPRIGRFSNGHVVMFQHSNITQVVLGTLILWFGWYAFNAGSTGCVLGEGCMDIAGRAATNTTLSIAAGGLMCLTITIVVGSPGDVSNLLNGILSGAVSITASCAFVEPYAAFVIGVVGACVYTGASKLLLRLRIDDPLDASAVHYFSGVWGVLAAGLFAREQYVEAVYGYADGYGVVYGGSGKQFGVQLLGVVVISAWTAGLTLVLFSCLRRVGWLRVSKQAELEGLDLSGSIGKGRLLGGFVGRVFSLHMFDKSSEAFSNSDSVHDIDALEAYQNRLQRDEANASEYHI
jgi:Amt family ammonium transporter